MTMPEPPKTSPPDMITPPVLDGVDKKVLDVVEHLPKAARVAQQLAPFFTGKGMPKSGVEWALLAFFGRLDRLRYLLSMAFLALVFWGFFSWTSGFYADPSMGKGLLILFVGGFLFLFGLFSFCAIACKRLHDIGYSGWFLLIFPPLFMISPWAVVAFFALFSLRLAVFPGTKGANRYGEPTPALIGESKDTVL